jgi:hypothetical protein
MNVIGHYAKTVIINVIGHYAKTVIMNVIEHYAKNSYNECDWALC